MLEALDDGRRIRRLLGCGSRDSARRAAEVPRGARGAAERGRRARIAREAARPNDRATRVAALPGPRVRDARLAAAATGGLRHAMRREDVPRDRRSFAACSRSRSDVVAVRRRDSRAADRARSGRNGGGRAAVCTSYRWTSGETSRARSSRAARTRAARSSIFALYREYGDDARAAEPASIAVNGGQACLHCVPGPRPAVSCRPDASPARAAPRWRRSRLRRGGSCCGPRRYR